MGNKRAGFFYLFDEPLRGRRRSIKVSVMLRYKKLKNLTFSLLRCSLKENNCLHIRQAVVRNVTIKKKINYNRNTNIFAVQ